MRLPVVLVLLASWLTLPVAAAEVVLAIVAPRAEGRDGKDTVAEAARRMARLLSQRGQTGGLEVLIEVHDDPCEREPSRALASRLAQSAAHVVIGYGCAVSAAVAAPVYAQAGKTLIVVGNGNGTVLPAGALQLPASGETQGQYLGRQSSALAAGADARIALVSDRTRWALTNVREASAVLQAAGKPPVRVETFAGGDKDFAGLSARLVGAGVTHVVLAAFGSEAGLFVADLVKASPGIVIVGTETLAGPEFLRAAGPAASQVLVALKPDSETVKSGSDVGRALVEGFERDKMRASRPALAVAAAVETVAAASRQLSGSNRPVTPQSLGEALRHPPPAAETILGPIVFVADGQASLAAWRLHRWTGGRLIPVQP